MAIENLTKADFERVINDNDGVILIDFWAEWCGPCRSFGMIFEQAANKYSDIKFYKVNIEKEQELAVDFGIRSIPHLMVYKGKEVIFSESGARNLDELDKLIQTAKG